MRTSTCTEMNRWDWTSVLGIRRTVVEIIVDGVKVIEQSDVVGHVPRR